MKNLRVVFMGTPEFASTILRCLIKNVDVVLVVSQPDRPVGRKKIITSSPVKMLALDSGIEVITPEKIKEDYKKIEDAKPDMIITCAYGQIIPKEVLDIPKLGCINVHASLLPELRGGAPIHRAIMEGKDKTGITIMYMDEHMDSGDIIAQKEVPILEEDTLDTLSQKLQTVGSDLLIETIPSIARCTNDRIKQDESQVTYGYIIKKEDELLNFDRSTKEVYDHIRALNSSPGAYFVMKDKHIKVYGARKGTKKGEISTINSIYKDGIGIGTKDGEIIITEIKPEGKNRISVKDYLNGIKGDALLGVHLNDKVD